MNHPFISPLPARERGRGEGPFLRPFEDSDITLAVIERRRYYNFLMLTKFKGNRICNKCGCTDFDCSRCIKRTGEPCHWVSPNLCSACTTQQTSRTKRT